MSGNKVIYTKSVYEQDGDIIRNVQNIEDAKKIIEILSKNNILGKYIVETSIFSEEEKLLCHKNLKGIIHSEEYTESMAYDVAKHAIDLSLILYNKGIYSWDLLPHNFTYKDGKWILYDFDAISLKPNKIKTQVRGFYKIIFSSFEFLKKVPRKDLKQCFLNRIKFPDLFKMLPFTDWFRLFLSENYCLLLVKAGLYKYAYLHLKYALKQYKKVIQKKEYSAKTTQLDQVRYSHINTLLNNYEIEDILCVGENAAKWAINTNLNNVNKTVYADDYEITDEIYNSINANNIKNITIGELFPLVDDDIIIASYKYRALYDSYAKKRFPSDCVILLNDLPENQSMEEFLQHISTFAGKMLIIQFTEENKKIIYEQLSALYNKVDFIHSISLIIAYDRNNTDNKSSKENSYTNYNRGDYCHFQTKEIMKILKKI
jgi:hypothetical protein